MKLAQPKKRRRDNDRFCFFCYNFKIIVWHIKDHTDARPMHRVNEKLEIFGSTETRRRSEKSRRSVAFYRRYDLNMRIFSGRNITCKFFPDITVIEIRVARRVAFSVERAPRAEIDLIYIDRLGIKVSAVGKTHFSPGHIAKVAPFKFFRRVDYRRKNFVSFII